MAKLISYLEFVLVFGSWKTRVCVEFNESFTVRSSGPLKAVLLKFHRFATFECSDGHCIGFVGAIDKFICSFDLGPDRIWRCHTGPHNFGITGLPGATGAADSRAIMTDV